MTHAKHLEMEQLVPPYPRYIINEEFAVNQAAPLAGVRTANPGPGILQIGDTTSALGLTGGEAIPTKASVSSNDPGMWHITGLARVGGRTLKSRLKNVSAFGTDANKTFSPMLVWADVAGSSVITDFEGIAYWVANTKFQVIDSISATQWTTIEPCSADTYNVMAIVLRRGGGAFHIVDGKLICVTRQNLDANVHPDIACLGSLRNPWQADYFKVADLGFPWNQDFGICDSYILRQVAVTDAFVHQAAGHIEFTITALPASSTITGLFRVQDASNSWRFNITAAGVISLDEVVAGTPTSRISMSGCQANDRIFISMNGATMDLKRDRPGAGVTNTTPYASALYTTRTAGQMTVIGPSGGIKDLACYPYNLSGQALAGINSIV